MTTLKLNKSLCQRAAEAARKAGYSSLEEFVEHAIEKQLAQYRQTEPEEPESKEEVLRKLKGLGYLD
jgi:metal-responsive CopG/Arc/MetJ family transcriptional regulator